MTKKADWLAGLLLVGAFLIGVAHAVSIDPNVAGGVVRLLLNGASRWELRVNSDGQLVVNENSTINETVMTLDDGSGGWGPRSRTNTQVSTLAADAEGRMIWNSTKDVLCVSTGTGAGAWIAVSTAGTASTSFSCWQ